jgi:molecular chaperone GrpE
VTTDNDNNPAASPGPSGESQFSSVRPQGNGETAVQDVAGASAEAALSPEAELRAERDKLREQLLRTAADFDNYRKRSKRDVDDARQRGKDEVIRDLLPVFDNLERALQSAPGVADPSSVIEGVRMVLKLFEDTTERLGLQRVKTIGERFDPAIHEAIQQMESHDHPPGTIIAEIAPGYRYGERLVRPAMVVVARKPSEQSKPEGNVPIQTVPE